jgi:asparagine synthase (glutamine-hydrolysing)
MARLAGLLAGQGGERLHAMLAAQAIPGGADHALSSGPARLGWHGRSVAQAASAGSLAAVVDGAFLGQTGNPAARLLSLGRERGFEAALRELRGDFTAALYDSAEDTLWLARDRLGVKPLYYANGTEGFAFASRPGALLGLPGIGRVADRRFVALFAGSHYRTFDNDPEASPYRDIRQLPAAHLLRVKGGKAELFRYWTLVDEGDLPADEGALAERYCELLSKAVSERLAIAPSPAFTLSGGMDSSSVLSLAVKALGAKQHAYSSTYADPTFDETAEIRSMLDANVEQWHPVAIGTPDVMGLVDRMVRANDEPVATATWLSHFLICERAARDGFGALFGGLGGDELNAGEYEYFFFHFADLRAAGREGALAGEVDAWARHHDHPIYRKDRAAAERGLARLVDPARRGCCLPDRQRLERYAAALQPGFFDLRHYEPVMDHPFGSYLKNRTWQDLFRETAPCCLRAEDRQCAAFGLEHFDPFLDERLLELMFRVPGALKIRDGVTKILLRRAMQGTLPEETRTRVKKTGWNAPAHVWFTGRNAAALRDLIASRAFRERGIYNPLEVDRLVREHEEIVASGEARENHMMFLWQLVNLESWLQAFRIHSWA